jgi:hypothetical protein
VLVLTLMPVPICTHVQVRTKAVRLTANMLWPKPQLRPAVEDFARDAIDNAVLPAVTAASTAAAVAAAATANGSRGGDEVSSAE